MSIPKICNFYWGGQPLAYLQYLSIVSFKKHNPDWKVNLFMPTIPSDVELPWQTFEQSDKYSGEDFIEQAKKLCDVRLIDFEELGMGEAHEVHRSDLIRWKLLYETGGVWSDMDILYIKPIPEIDADVCLVFDGFHHIIGFFMAKPNSKIFKDIYTTAKDLATPEGLNNYQSIGSRLLMRMFPRWNDVVQRYPESHTVSLPISMVYPYGSHTEDLEEMFSGRKNKVTDETIGIHWFNGSSQAKEYLNDFGNLKKNRSKLSREVRKLECSL